MLADFDTPTFAIRMSNRSSTISRTSFASWWAAHLPYYEDMTSPARFAFGLLAIALFGSGLKAQSCGTFDVASIKLNTSGVGGGYPELVPGGRHFTATNQLILELIMFAYGVSPRQISGIPSTFFKERYDIEAMCDGPMTKEHLPDMLQVLLAERFHLSVHRELKEQTHRPIRFHAKLRSG
jgi:hypothetical protein